MTTEWRTHSNFGGGIFTDLPGYLVPEDGLWDALDILCDVPGKLRKRGGTTATGTVTAALTGLLAFEPGADQLSNRVMGVGGTGASGNKPHWYIIDTADGSLDQIELGGPASNPGAAYTLGQPFMFEGFAVAPVQCPGDKDYNWLMLYGGAPANSAKYEPNGTAGTVTAGSATVTQSGVDYSANSKVGDIVVIKDGSSKVYIGRVVKITSATSIDVDPIPPISISASTTKGICTYPSLLIPEMQGTSVYGGSVGCAYQGRIVLADCASPAGHGVNDARRVIWSNFGFENSRDYSGTTVYFTGLTQVYRESFLPNNFTSISGADPLVSLRPIGQGTLGVFSKKTSWEITGDLPTLNEVTINPFTYDVQPVDRALGTLSDWAMQSTSRGLIFPTSEGVYGFDGNRLAPLMDKRLAKTFRDALKTNGPTWIRGSAVVRNHYILCTSTGQYALNLDASSPVWTRLSNIDLFAGITDPTDPAIFWGLRWWDTSTTAPSHVGGQCIRTDSIFNPTSSNKNDADTTAVTFTIKSRSFAEGDTELLKKFTRASYEYRLTGAGVVTASIDGNLEPADAAFETVGTLPPNTALAVTNATNASPIVITTATHSYATGDRVVIRDVAGNTAANGAWWITVLSATTFSLNTSSGNGSYTSGGSASQPDVKGFEITRLIPRSFAIIHKIVGSTATDRFELLAIKHAAQALRPGRQS